MEHKDKQKFYPKKLQEMREACQAIPFSKLQTFINRLELNSQQVKMLHFYRFERDIKIDKRFNALADAQRENRDTVGALNRTELHNNNQNRYGHKLDKELFPIDKLLPIYYKKVPIPFPLLDIEKQLDILFTNGIKNKHLYTFRRVPGFNYIFITRTGFVYDAYRGKLLHMHLRQFKTNGWYVSVVLSNNDKVTYKFNIHRLLAIAYIPLKDHIKNMDTKDLIVNHIDGDKTNFSLENLEWCTSSENNSHAIRNKLNIKGSINPVRSIKVTNPANEKSVVFTSIAEASEVMELGITTIYQALNRENNHTHGYLYEYLE